MTAFDRTPLPTHKSGNDSTYAYGFLSPSHLVPDWVHAKLKSQYERGHITLRCAMIAQARYALQVISANLTTH
jgi:hypothetical protein